MKLLFVELENVKNGEKINKEHKDFFSKKLTKTNNLIVFESVIKSLKNDSMIDKYLIKMSSVFQKLSLSYRRKDSIHKAYYAHMLLSLPKITKSDDDLVCQTMLNFAADKSIYCRENAMLFLYKNGSAHLVVEALKKMKNKNLYYNAKLLADDLLKFTGSQKELSTLLLLEFDQFSINTEVAIINYLRFVKGDNTEKIFQMYKSHKYDKEVELAMIRYFSKHPYPIMLDELMKLIENKDENNYEYRLIAASTLASYDYKKVHYGLIDCLSDTNWYVRKNAALSLSKMTLTEKEINLLKSLKDPYAREMIEDIWREEGKKIEYVPNNPKKEQVKEGVEYVSVH